MNQRQAAYKLNTSQCLLGRMLKSRQEIGNASLANERSDRKRKRINVIRPLLRLKVKELANKMGKNYFVHIYRPY